MYSLLLDEGELGIAIFLILPLFLALVVVGFIVPIATIITYLIYHFKLHYKFTWAKDFIEQEQAKAQSE